ncbi:MAG: class I SAM-dependent methyltransferase [Anaerolineae bacterium]|jgi:SAM-dependent methyltransferase|nr:class I SAM-dependent methyltransferase [Anaerolineae bacterium]
MNLLDIVRRAAMPEPWTEGDRIPWDEPGFSARMLKEHLSQAHDAASRRFETIDRQVLWIHTHVLGARPARILDLGCGPGLYASRLARLGHTCVGIDFGPASVAYARDVAEREGLACTYQLADLREADFGKGFGLVMLIYGEMNVFRPADIESILAKAAAALAPGGMLLLEPQSYEHVEREATTGPSWYAATSGLFSDRPHIVLTENSWDAERAAGTTRHIVVDAGSGDVAWHAMSNQAYTTGRFRELLTSCGFGDIAFYPSLTGVGLSDDGLLAIVARTQVH